MQMIDEVHTLIGAGAAEGAIDAANILKPALARGELQCIGATTLDEYRKHIEKDPALERYVPVSTWLCLLHLALLGQSHACKQQIRGLTQHNTECYSECTAVHHCEAVHQHAMQEV